MLAGDVNIQGYMFSQGTTISYNDLGEIQCAILADDMRIEGVSLFPGDIIYFLKSGEPWKVLLGAKIPVRMIKSTKYLYGTHFYYR